MQIFLKNGFIQLHLRHTEKWFHARGFWWFGYTLGGIWTCTLHVFTHFFAGIHRWVQKKILLICYSYYLKNKKKNLLVNNLAVLNIPSFEIFYLTEKIETWYRRLDSARRGFDSRWIFSAYNFLNKFFPLF